MRIQHNIPALNAYRSYTQNVAAMKKNLEKLSSGYRINRAGDDAAGLAISEKMRAQITGLEVAQKNAKDGISLVQTAEGAMTEVHDMLNRMYELAEQSANGTYDNETDRAQMQKEIQSLSDEINRIADSSNFNGIKLVDGSLSKDGVAATTKMFSDLPGVGQILGTNTVLHQAKNPNAPTTTELSLDFHNIEIDGKAGDQFAIDVGGTTLTGTLAADGTVTGADIAAELAGTGGGAKVSFEVNSAAYSATSVQFGDGTFQATSASGTRVSFEQTDDADVDPDMKVEITEAKATSTATPVQVDVVSKSGLAAVGTPPTVTMTGTVQNARDGDGSTNVASFEVVLGTPTLTGPGGVKLSIYGADVTSDGVAGDATAEEIAAAFNGKSIQFTFGGVGSVDFDITANGNTLTFTERTGSTNTGVNVANNINATTVSGDTSSATNGYTEIDFGTQTGAQVAGKTLTVGDKTYEFIKTGQTASGSNVGVTVADADNASTIATALAAATNPGNASMTASGSKVRFTDTGTAGATSIGPVVKGASKPTITGDYNVSTTVLKKKAENAAERLASTYFSLTEDMVGQGNSIKIASSNYVFQTEKGNEPKLGANDVKVDISDLDAEAADYMTRVAERLTEAAKDNAVYTVGHDGSRITVTETVAHADLANPANYPSDEYDLTTLEGIQKSLGYSTAAKAGSGGLSLQIGDTADSYNKLTVSINDCHAAAMGLGDIDISTQDGASAAMKKIKSAINYVSDVRGDLGALQNRLDHTINNLSVMHENIQDAESTIRDVDIAEEMMAYTKNNILVQSSQAMLAQANQLPQGVLQLLQ